MTAGRAFARTLLHGCAMLTMLAGCPDAGEKRGSPAPTAPTISPGASRALPAPLPPASRSSVRENAAAGAVTEGASLESRALRSRVTRKDGLGLALRLRPEAGPAGSGWSLESIDWTKVRASLRFQVKTPAGTTHAFEVAEPLGSPNVWPISLFVQSLTIDGSGITQGPVRQPWKVPVAGLLDTPGDYEVSVTGSFSHGGKELSLSAGPLKLTVVEEGKPLRALVDLERAASEIARATWGVKGIPVPADPTVDDAEGNVSVRFRQSGGGASPGSGYDDDVLEVWLDAAGKTLAVDAYSHFTCVAEGTSIETPRGPIPIEELVVGAEVDAFDVVTGVRSVATVLSMQRSHSESLWQLGDLGVTAEHPVWADGAWLRAADVPAGARLLGAFGEVSLAAPSVMGVPSTVYDLTVSPPHTYFAGGILVHNKAAHVPLGGERPWGPLFFRRAAKP